MGAKRTTLRQCAVRRGRSPTRDSRRDLTGGSGGAEDSALRTQDWGRRGPDRDLEGDGDLMLFEAVVAGGDVLLEPMLRLVIDTISMTLEQAGHARPELHADTNILHDTELDSMGLAVVVVQLEELTGKDPFAEGFVNFSTVGELAALYGR